MIDAIRKLPSSTGGVGQSAENANVVLQAIRRSNDVDLPNIPRIRQPQSGNSPAGGSQAVEVYHGPFQGSIRDPSRDFPLTGRNRIIQERNPAEHIEVLEAIRPRQQITETQDGSLTKDNAESGFLESRVQRDSNAAMKSLNPADLKNIITDWTAFKIDHPVGAKVVKYTGWLY